MATTLKHPVLGEVVGNQHRREDVIQYLGIQYATLAHRFASPVVKKDYGGRVDAGSFGPSVVSSPMGCDIEFGLIQKCLERPPIPAISDLDGLNLNITVPANGTSSEGSKFPVLCFIHGGGFLVGGTWAPHYDLAPLVAFSASIGKPIVGVSINYRLGVPGFLDSEELRASGSPPNRGILDQQAALQWLRQNIAGFGGDPGQITAIGQSAGGSSVMHLLNLDEADAPPFDRAVCLSGNLMAAAIFPEHVAQAAYSSVLQYLGINPALSGDEQVAALATIAPDELLTKVPPTVPLGPVVSDDQLPSFEAMKQKSPVKHGVSLLSGSTDLDGAIFEVLGLFAGRGQSPSALVEDFTNGLRRFVPHSQHQSISNLLGLYDIPADSTDAKRVQLNIVRFGTDLKYFASTRGYALSWPSESWMYYFKEPNPWEGPYQGYSAHCLDTAYLFLNYKHVMTESQLEVAKAFASDVLGFAYGDTPWPEFRSSKRTRIYGRAEGSRESQTVADEESIGPSPAIRELWDEIGLDLLARAWDAYFAKQ